MTLPPIGSHYLIDGIHAADCWCKPLDPRWKIPCDCDNDGWYVHDEDCPRGIAWEGRGET